MKLIFHRKIDMSKWNREYVNNIRSELRRKINNPDNVLIKFRIIGEIDLIQMKTLTFLQIQLTGIAYLPEGEQWDVVEEWVLSCPLWSEVVRYSEGIASEGI